MMEFQKKLEENLQANIYLPLPINTFTLQIFTDSSLSTLQTHISAALIHRLLFVSMQPNTLIFA